MTGELFKQLAEYWQMRDKLFNRRELLEALKTEAKGIIKHLDEVSERRMGQGRGGGHGIGGYGAKKLDSKAVAHMKDNKFTGKDGGAGGTTSTKTSWWCWVRQTRTSRRQ